MKKTGLKFSRKMKWTILVLALAGALCCAGVFGYFMLKHIKKAGRFREAVAVLNSGDLKLASEKLAACIAEDANNQGAIENYARLLEKECRWGAASYMWRRAVSLEPRREYIDAELFSTAIAMNFKLLASRLETIRENEGSLSSDRARMLALAYIYTRRKSDAAKLLSSHPAAKEKGNDFNDLLDFYLNPPKKISPDKLFARLQKISSSKNLIVRFLALSEICDFAGKKGDARLLEESLQKICAFHPEWGLVKLGDFYAGRNDFKKAGKYYSESMNYMRLPTTAVKLGEILAAAGDSAGLKKLGKIFRHGSIQMLQTGYYIDAMTAFVERDRSKLARSMKPVRGVFRTPAAAMLELHAAVIDSNPGEIVTVLNRIALTPELKKVYPDAVKLAASYADGLVKKGNFSEAAPILRLTSDPKKPELVATRVMILDALRANRLSSFEMNRALSFFPYDSVLLHMAVDRALGARDFQEAAKNISTLEKLRDNSMQTLIQSFCTLEGLGRYAEALEKIKTIRGMKEGGTDRILSMCVQFCAAHSLNRAMKELAAELANSKSCLAPRYRAFLESELAFNEKKTADAISLAKKASSFDDWNPKDPDELLIMFRLATRLGAHDVIPQALSMYEKIINDFKPKAIVLANISELLAAKGDKRGALALAEEALMLNSANPAAIECCGARLAENGLYARAASLLRPLVGSGKASPRAVEQWRKALEKVVVKLYNDKEYYLCRENCRLLVARSDKGGIGSEYLEKANKALREQISKGSKTNAVSAPAKKNVK